MTIFDLDERELAFGVFVALRNLSQDGIDLVRRLPQFGIMKGGQFGHLPKFCDRTVARWTLTTIDLSVFERPCIRFLVVHHELLLFKALRCMVRRQMSNGCAGWFECDGRCQPDLVMDLMLPLRQAPGYVDRTSVHQLIPLCHYAARAMIAS